MTPIFRRSLRRQLPIRYSALICGCFLFSWPISIDAPKANDADGSTGGEPEIETANVP
jgi:hypothetical protein